MNEGAYDGLSDAQKEAVDSVSGLDFSIFAGGVMQDTDAPARDIAVELGNNIITVSADDAANVWKPVVDPIYASWVAEMAEKDIDGAALIAEAQALMSGSCAGATADY